MSDPRYLDGAQWQKSRIRNQYLSPGDLVDQGLRVIEPKPDPGRFSPGTVRQFGTEIGTDVSRTRISPAQKDVVQKYFGQ